MDERERRMHLAAGMEYGVKSTCGEGEHQKINYVYENTAIVAAAKGSEKYSKAMEAYPCPWCDGWHIGRKMTEEERERFMPDDDPEESIRVTLQYQIDGNPISYNKVIKLGDVHRLIEAMDELAE